MMLRQLTCHLEKQIKLDCDFTPYTNIIQMDQRFKCNDETVKILGDKWVIVTEWGELSKHDIKFRSHKR